MHANNREGKTGESLFSKADGEERQEMSHQVGW